MINTYTQRAFCLMLLSALLSLWACDVSAIGFKSRAEKAYTAAEDYIDRAKKAESKNNTKDAVAFYLAAIEALDATSAADATWEAGKVAIKQNARCV